MRKGIIPSYSIRMKTSLYLVLTAVLTCVAVPALAQTDTSWSFGVRQHTEQPDFPDISMGDELSYGLAVQASDAGGYWQAALLYTPDIEGFDDVDYALTPQLNLMLQEGIWRTGVGGARTYVKSDSDSGWNDFYWQLMLGIGLPGAGSTSIEVQAIYVFDEWGNVSDFDTHNLEYAIWIGMPF